MTNSDEYKGGKVVYRHYTTESFGSVLQSMKKCFENQELCDVTLKTNDGLIKTHKVMLAVTSKYFLAMIQQNQQLTEIDGTEFDATCLSALIDYFYSGVMVFYRDDLETLCSLVQKLEVLNCEKLCENLRNSV